MTSTTDGPVSTRPSLELISEIEQTLYREARLLDREQHDEWMAMLAPVRRSLLCMWNIPDRKLACRRNVVLR